MSINKLIKDTLESLQIPVEFQTYDGEDDPYITFFCYNEQGEKFADDDEIETGFYMQVDIWSKGNIEQLKINVINLLKEAGFKRKTVQDLYESDTQTYHKCIRFFYAQKNGNEEE